MLKRPALRAFVASLFGLLFGLPAVQDIPSGTVKDELHF